MSEHQDTVEQTNILLVFACPEGTDALRLGTEERVIRECLDRSRYRDNFNVEVRQAATTYDVRRALLGGDYRIVQFSAHGTGRGLVLEDAHGQAQLVPQDALADLLSAYSPPIQCVILNACHTDTQGQLVSLGVPYTIGMIGRTSDAAATEFTRGFYDAIGAGRDVEFAFQEGCRAVNLAGLGDEFEPVLFTETRDREQAEIRIVSQQQVIFGEEQEEEGFLDYVLDGTESFEEVTAILARITDRIYELGEDVAEHTKQLQVLASLEDQPNLREYRRVVNRMGDTLEAFARQLGDETPMFRETYSRAIDCYGKATTLLTTDFEADSTEQVEEALTVVGTLQESMTSARSGQGELRQTIARLPRMTGKLNRAKRQCLAAIDNFDKEIQAALDLTGEVERLMQGLLGQ
jgi:hypothetical protein